MVLTSTELSVVYINIVLILSLIKTSVETKEGELEHVKNVSNEKEVQEVRTSIRLIRLTIVKIDKPYRASRHERIRCVRGEG